MESVLISIKFGRNNINFLCNVKFITYFFIHILSPVESWTDYTLFGTQKMYFFFRLNPKFEILKLFLYLLLFFPNPSLFAEKVLIITSAYNRPDFIEFQFKTFEKFLTDDYEFVVFNDATSDSMQTAIMETCTDLKIKCINIPQTIHKNNNPSNRNSAVVNYALQNLGFSHNGIVCIIDSDLFLVKKFSIKESMNGYQIMGVPQGNQIPYIWIGIAFLDMNNLQDHTSIDFNCGKINNIGVDAGGYTYYYLNSHPDVQIKYFGAYHSYSFLCHNCLNADYDTVCTHNKAALEEYGLDESQISALHAGMSDVDFFLEGAFFHYRSGTNWNQKSNKYHDIKTEIFNRYMNEILSP